MGYLAWSNDSFPVEQKPFGDYTKIVSSPINGTEYAFEIRWRSADYLPIYAQLTSPLRRRQTPRSAEPVSPLWWLGRRYSCRSDLQKPSPVLTNVDLSIAVRSVAMGDEFTIVYHVDSVSAQPGKIVPSDISCQQPTSVM